ncbi:OmpA family protein [Thermopolyspora sp. NPDC052614]|uniref:OmpA family protein n=1 Tax=Thermopolyspora sp. NPDC052614 TaxID=3155682 RepID=UPI0034340FB4
MSEPTAALLAAREVALAQARILARNGRYAEAEGLLEDAWRGADRGVPFLDLLARIKAQQGDLRAADRYWAEAERLAPGDREIAAGRRRIAAMTARGPVAWRRARAAVVIGAGFLATAVLVPPVEIRLTVGEPRDVIKTPVDYALTTPTSAPAPSPSIASSTSPRTAPPTAPPTASVLDELDLQARGLRVRRSPDEIAVTFEDGLFRSGATLSAGGRAVLRELAVRLRPHADRISVAVIGHTDDLAVPPGGPYASNMELAMLRATVVREVLRDAAGIPTARFSVSALGAMMPPYRGDDPWARARNRTVSLRIAAAGRG